MGRGDRDQANGAAGLLFGPRRRGSGPVAQELPPRPVDQIGSIVDVAVSTGLVADGKEARFKLEENGFFVAQGEQGCATIYAKEDGESSGIRIHYAPYSYEGERGNLVEAGDAPFASLADLEHRLRQPCEQAEGIDYLEMGVSGQEALDRFDRGEKVDLALKGDDLEAKKQELKGKLMDLLDIGIIQNSQDIEELNQLIALQFGDENNMLASIAANKTGRETLERTRHIDIRSQLG